MEAARHHEQGREIILVGHRGHPEVVGTLGQLPAGAIHLVESADDARAFVPRDSSKLAYVTQTTLSLDDTAEIVAVLKERFPGIGGPVKEDICYATTNRQNAVKAIAPQSTVLSSSAARRARIRCASSRSPSEPGAILVPRRTRGDIPWSKLEGATAVGITAGASAPEVIVEEVVEAFRERYDVTIDVVTTLEERVIFNVPREVRLRAPRPSSIKAPFGAETTWRSTPKSTTRSLRALSAPTGWQFAVVQGHCRRCREHQLSLHTTTGAFILTIYEKRVDPEDCRFFSD